MDLNGPKWTPKMAQNGHTNGPNVHTNTKMDQNGHPNTKMDTQP